MGDAGTGTDTAAIERVNSTLSGSRVLEWPNHHALDQCDVGAAMCCTTSSRDSSQADPNSEICYVDMAASRRSARVNDGYSIYGQDQTNDVYCEAFAWGTDEGSIKSALKGNALFEIGFANMLNGRSSRSLELLSVAASIACPWSPMPSALKLQASIRVWKLPSRATWVYLTQPST